MTNERKIELKTKILNVWNSIQELEDLLTEKDVKWADRQYDKLEEGDEAAAADEELIISLINLNDDLRDTTKHIGWFAEEE